VRQAITKAAKFGQKVLDFEVMDEVTVSKLLLMAWIVLEIISNVLVPLLVWLLL